jgi:IclR family transcriptional regulator, acetate operon repressor
MSPSNSNQIQSIARAVSVLEALRLADHPLSTAEIARELAIDRTVAHRLVKTLSAVGFLNETAGRYHLGPRSLLYSNAYLDRLSIRRVALPYAIELQSRTIKESPWVTALSVVVNDSVTIIDRIWSPGTPLDTILDVGLTFRLDSSGGGRCALAYMTPADAQHLIGKPKYQELEPRMQLIREAGGVETALGDAGPGIGAIVAAIFNRSGTVIGTFGVSGPAMDDVLDRRSELATSLRRAADGIGQALFSSW